MAIDSQSGNPIQSGGIEAAFAYSHGVWVGCR
jgi:hypothetical protein